MFKGRKKTVKYALWRKLIMELLPSDTLFVIYEFIGIRDILQVCHVSKSWYPSVIARHDRIWVKRHSGIVENIGTDFLNAKEKKKMESSKSLKSFYGKYFFLRIAYLKKSELVYLNKYNCWARRDKMYVFEDTPRVVDHDLKVLFRGDYFSGKTSFLKRYCENRWQRKYLPTIYDNKVAKFRFQDEMVGLKVWDTVTDVDDYPTPVIPHCYRNLDVAVLCFDLSYSPSLDHIRTKWFKEVRKYSPQAAIVICGCKSDLRIEQNRKNLKRVVKDEYDEVKDDKLGTGMFKLAYERSLKMDVISSPDEALEKVVKFLVPEIYIEVSAKENYNVNETGIAIVFAYIMKQVESRFFELPQEQQKEKDRNKNSGKCKIM